MPPDATPKRISPSGLRFSWATVGTPLMPDTHPSFDARHNIPRIGPISQCPFPRRPYLNTTRSVGLIALLRTKIQATITAQATPTAPDGNAIARRSGTARTTLRERATAKSDQNGQFLLPGNNWIRIFLTRAVGKDTPKLSRLQTFVSLG
jgi:hypothetical protein